MDQDRVRRMILLVVGADLRAEAADRPLAYGLQKQMQRRLAEWSPGSAGPLEAVVCTDLWYLNHQSVHDRPMVSIGGPGVNGVSAWLWRKLPTVLAVEQRLLIQMDADLSDLRCTVWGVDAAHTAGAVELFSSKYLDAYLEAAVRQAGQAGSSGGLDGT